MADSSVAATHPGSIGHGPTGHAGDVTKRDLLQLIAISGAAIGAGAIIWPLIDSMNPSKDVLALSSVDVDLASVVEGQGITIVWQGKPIFVRHRTPTETKEAQDVPLGQLIEPQSDSARTKAGHDQWIVLIGICTHLGLRTAGQQAVGSPRRVGWLVLPLPWQPIRHVRSCAPRPSTGKSGAAPLRFRIRYQNQGRLNALVLRPATGKQSWPA